MAKREVSSDVDVESVRFHPIDAQLGRGKDITVRYTVGERFSPKSGDWIGLFRVDGSGRTEHQYIGFCWARKYSGWKEDPLERTVDFRISDFKIPEFEKDIYFQFVYVTSSEKISYSNEFQILPHVPITVCKKRKPSSPTEQNESTCRNSVVPYELFHRPQTLVCLENVEIHPCCEDLTTLCRKADATKNPIVSCFMATSGLKDWARMTVYVPQPYKRSCSSCQIAKDVITSLRKRLDTKKQAESNTGCYSQKECEDLEALVCQLKTQKMALESALYTERLAKWTLVHKYAQTKQELLTYIAQMASFLLETQSSPIKQVARHNWLDQGSNSESKENKQSKVTTNQNKAVMCIAAHNTDNKCPTKPRVKQLPLANRHEKRCTMRNAEVFGKNSDTEVKKAFNHSKDVPYRETYSGSRIGINRLFKEAIAQYSGSNITFGRLFDERSHRQMEKDTYSGSNLALSRLFNEEHEDIRNRVDKDDRSGYASCYCHCAAEIDSSICRKDPIDFSSSNEMAKDVPETSATDEKKMTPENSFLTDGSKSHSSDDHEPCLCSKDNPGSEADKKQDTTPQKKIADRLPNTSLRSKEIPGKPIKKTSKHSGKAPQTNIKVSCKTKAPTKHSESAGSNAHKMDATVQADGFLYHGGVYWMSNESNSPAKPCAFSPSCRQTNDEVIPPAKSLTVSGIEQTGGKLEVLKQPMVAKMQAEISRDAKSVSSLGRTVPKTQGNELTINSTPAITTNRKPKMNKDENLAADPLTQKKQDLTSHTTNAQSIQTADSNDPSSLVNDINVISILHTGNNTACPAPNTKIFLAQQKTDEPKVIISGEQNKKRKKCSVADSSTKSTDLEHLKILAHQNTTHTDQLPHEKCPYTPTTLDDSAKKRTSIKQQCVAPTSSGQIGAGRAVQSIRNDNKISLSESAHSTGTGIIPNIFAQIQKGLPLLSCPFLPPTSETLQTDTRANEDTEYPPLPSTPNNNRETRSSQDQAAASYAFVTKQDPQTVNQQAPKRAFHSLAKLAKKILHKYCGSDDELETLRRQDTFICSGGMCQNPHNVQQQGNTSKEPQTYTVHEVPENHAINTSMTQTTAQNNDYICTIKPFDVVKNSQDMDQVLIAARGSYKSPNGKSRMQETVTNPAATDFSLQQTQASNKTQSNNTTTGKTEQDETAAWNIYWKYGRVTTTKKMKKKTEGKKY